MQVIHPTAPWQGVSPEDIYDVVNDQGMQCGRGYVICDYQPAIYPERPVRIYFTAAEVMADILPVGIIEDGERAGQMDTIDDPDVAAWYEPGPAPGGPGNALINGHKSWKGKIGRFSVLWDMQTGDEVIIEYADGSLAAFYADSIAFYPYNAVPDEVMSLEGESRVTLITCYGEFDRQAGTSEERCVVVLKGKGA